MKLTIGVVSDTHGLFRQDVERCLAGVAHIIHAGDIGAPSIVDRLRRIAPVTVVRGNVDRGKWAESFPETETLRLGGRSFYVLHDLNALAINPADLGIDVVISGHSHRVRVETVDGILYLNPGSAGPRRFKLPITLATLDLGKDGSIEPMIHTLASGA
jgi:putative phosphoesterase